MSCRVSEGTPQPHTFLSEPGFFQGGEWCVDLPQQQNQRL